MRTPVFTAALFTRAKAGSPQVSVRGGWTNEMSCLCRHVLVCAQGCEWRSALRPLKKKGILPFTKTWAINTTVNEGSQTETHTTGFHFHVESLKRETHREQTGGCPRWSVVSGETQWRKGSKGANFQLWNKQVLGVWLRLMILCCAYYMSVTFQLEKKNEMVGRRRGWPGRTQAASDTVSVRSSIIHLSKPRDCTARWASPSGNHALWWIMLYQCWLIGCNTPHSWSV